MELKLTEEAMNFCKTDRFYFYFWYFFYTGLPVLR